MQARTNPVHLAALEEWLASYRPAELFEESGAPIADVLAACPTGEKRMGANPHVIGGNMRKPLNLPDLAKHAVKVDSHGAELSSALAALGHYFADVFTMNADEKNFRIMCPDEVASNRLTPVFDVEDHCYVWPLDPEIDTGHRRDGRIMEILSEHNCQGWLQGYVLTGRHGVFPCYEAFIPIVDGMVNQYGKFMTMAKNEAPWRTPVSGMNYLLTSEGWRQDHNGYSHQMPGFINSMLNRKSTLSRIYLPADANTLLVTMDKCMRDTDVINLVIASKNPLPQWLSIDEAKDHVAQGASKWDWASSDGDGEPDIVLASCGTIPTIELLAAANLLHQEVPELKVRFVNVNDLYALASSAHHPMGLSQAQFTQLFTKDRPVLFNFHGYPSAIHQLIHRRPQQARFHVRGYMEEGTTTTPFELLAMNGVDRYQLAIEALTRADILAAEMLPSMSGEFAVRAVPNAEAAINKFRAELERLRATVKEIGDDPAEITEWVWTSANGHGKLDPSVM
jgi:xylulose-5-phosphate/fructose-6-phosphate phosphoketolase